MKRLILPLLILPLMAFANKDEVSRLVSQKEYTKACLLGNRIYQANLSDEKFIKQFGIACLNADYIDFLTVPAVKLRSTKSYRESASLFATMVLKKRLLYFAMVDKVDLTGLKLPKIDHVLSVVFDRYAAGDYTKEGEKFIFKTESGKNIVLYLRNDKDSQKVIIEEPKEDDKTATHVYW